MMSSVFLNQKAESSLSTCPLKGTAASTLSKAEILSVVAISLLLLDSFHHSLTLPSPSAFLVPRKAIGRSCLTRSSETMLPPFYKAA